MKRIISSLTLIGVLFLLGACGEDQGLADAPFQVPGQIKEAFAEQFPDATEVEWEASGNNFEAEFDLKGQEMEALYHSSSRLLEVEMAIDSAALPPVIHDYVKDQYPGFKMKEIAQVLKGDVSFYEVEIEQGKEEKELLFDAEGNFKEEEQEDEDKDD